MNELREIGECRHDGITDGFDENPAALVDGPFEVAEVLPNQGIRPQIAGTRCVPNF